MTDRTGLFCIRTLIVLFCLAVMAGKSGSWVYAQETPEVPAISVETFLNNFIDPFQKPSKLRQLEEKIRRDKEEALLKAEAERIKAATDAAERERLRLESLKVDAPPPTLPAMAFTGIVYGTQKPLAVLNGNVYAVGDIIALGKDQGTAKLVSVSPGQVKIFYMGIEHQLKLYTEAVKHDSE